MCVWTVKLSSATPSSMQEGEDKTVAAGSFCRGAVGPLFCDDRPEVGLTSTTQDQVFSVTKSVLYPENQ